MRTISVLASAALISATVLAGPALADDHLHLTPPLYREQARVTQQVRSPSDLTTTPQLVPAASASRTGKVSAAARVLVEASAASTK